MGWIIFGLKRGIFGNAAMYSLCTVPGGVRAAGRGARAGRRRLRRAGAAPASGAARRRAAAAAAAGARAAQHILLGRRRRPLESVTFEYCNVLPS